MEYKVEAREDFMMALRFDLWSQLGRASGILGLFCLLLAMMLSVRRPGFDRWFGGLTRLWKVHHVLGAASFLLLVAHPLLLAVGLARLSLRTSIAVLFPGPAGWSVWAGWLSLAVMAIFLAPTFRLFGRPRYQRWKALHALSGLALGLAMAHALPLSRFFPGGRGTVVWLGFGVPALLVFAYRVFAARRLAGRRHTVVHVETVNRGVVELTLKPDKQALNYRPGQFIYLTPLDPGLAHGRNEEHPYTLSSAPSEAVLRVAIKDLGDATHALQTVAPGSPCLVEGPYGAFLPAAGKPARELWIAGGIGIAPFLSRARAFTLAEPVDIHLIYCAQDESRAHFLPELQGIAARLSGNSSFKVRPHFFAREGPLAAAFLETHCPDFVAREIYACGPPPLVALTRRICRRAGVPASHLHTEEFSWL